MYSQQLSSHHNYFQATSMEKLSASLKLAFLSLLWLTVSAAVPAEIESTEIIQVGAEVADTLRCWGKDTPCYTVYPSVCCSGTCSPLSIWGLGLCP